MDQIPKLGKFIPYVLGRHPDEFGLITDENGFVKIKTLLQALNEEPHWKFVRRFHFDELQLAYHPAPIEIQGNLIRCTDRTHLPQPRTASSDLPKLLYTPIRQRAHPIITDRGIFPNTGVPHVVLARDREMAQRMGRRLDNRPLLIIVKVKEAAAAGVTFKAYGEHLFLADQLPPDAVISPPPARVSTADIKAEKDGPAAQAKTPGSFFWHPEGHEGSHAQGDKAKRRNSEDWKKQRRLARKHKKKIQNSD